MKKRLLPLLTVLALCLALFPATAALAADAPERGVLTYEEVIAPQFDEAQAFSEGLAAVRKDGKWGYIDTTGSVVVPYQYAAAYAFSEGLAIVQKDLGLRTKEVERDLYDEDAGEWITYTTEEDYYAGEWGFIDKKGNYTPFVCNIPEDAEEPYSAGDYDYDGPYIKKNVAVERTEPFEADMNIWDNIFYNGYIFLYVPEAYRAVLFNTRGEEIDLEAIWRAANPGENRYWYSPVFRGYQVTEGILLAYEPYSADNQDYFFDMTTGQFSDLPDPMVMNPPPPSDDPEGGYADFYSKYLRPFNQGLAPCKDVVHFYDWSNGEPETFVATDAWGFINRAGEWVIEPQFDNFWVQDVEGGYICFGETGCAVVEKDGKWGTVDKLGNTVIPFQYEELHASAEGLMAFSEGGKWGFIHSDDLSVAIPARFDQVTNFNGGYAVAVSGDDVILIDRKGSPIPNATGLNLRTYFGESGEIFTPTSYVVIERNGKYGYGHVSFTPVLPEKTDTHTWAYDEVVAAIEADLVPTYLQNLYGEDISRAQFCDLAVAVLEAATGKDIEDIVLEKSGKTLDQALHQYPFIDSADRSTMACYALGIVNGRGDGTFDPYASITRQEAAAYLQRTAKVLGLNVNAAANTFVDKGAIGVWFTDAVDFVTAAGIMNGTGGNAFSPLGTYTREQAYLTLLRLYRAAR